jgi:hypothetical protein
MANDEINYINLICDLEKAGKCNKEAISNILYRYNIPKIESVQRRVLSYIFSIHDDELRYRFFNMISAANNLPIITECYCVIYSAVSKEEYVAYQVKNIGGSRNSLRRKYELCMQIISQSSFLQERQKMVNEYKEHTSEYTNFEGLRVRSHKYRNRVSARH